MSLFKLPKPTSTNHAANRKTQIEHCIQLLKQAMDNPKESIAFLEFFKINATALQIDLPLLNTICACVVDEIIDFVFNDAIWQMQNKLKIFLECQNESECCNLCGCCLDCSRNQPIKLEKNIAIGDFEVKFQAVFQTCNTYIHTAYFIMQNHAKTNSQYHALIGVQTDIFDIIKQTPYSLNGELELLENAKKAMHGNIMALKTYIANPIKKLDMAKMFGATIQKLLFNH